MMLFHILQGVRPENYCLIAGHHPDAGKFEDNFSEQLPAQYHYLDEEFQLTRGYRFGLSRVRKAINIPLAVQSRAKSIATVLQSEGCDAVVACSGNVFDIPAAYLASRRLNVKFYPYYFDYYSYQHTDPITRFFAQRFEPIFLKRATGVIVPNEFLQAELKQRYAIGPIIVRNPVNVGAYEALKPNVDFASDGETRIVYTGAVYAAHYDAFRNLLSAVGSLDQLNVKLHLYSASPENWEAVGMRGPIVHHEHEHLSAVPGIQRDADILFLPLAFKSPYPEVIRTSAAGKMGEYLAARRPILVHAPADSFIAWYFRKHECGLVVDQQEPALLAQAIERLASDAHLRQQLCERAGERARADFRIESAQKAFKQLLKLDA